MRAFRSPNPCFLAILLPLLSAPRLSKPQAWAALEDIRESACQEVSRAGSWGVHAMETLGALSGTTEVTWLAVG